jgi:hypothetical protein
MVNTENGRKRVKFRACVTDEEVFREIQLVPPADKRNQKIIQDCVATVLDKRVRKLGLCEYFTAQTGDSTDVINVAILLFVACRFQR